MRYCSKCDAEFTDDTLTLCPDDGQPLLERAAWEAERRRQGREPRRLHRLVTIARIPNRFEAEELAVALVDEGLEVALVEDKGLTVGPLTTPGPSLFALSVAEADAERAEALVKGWRQALEAPGAVDEAVAAAERESVEPPVPPAS